MSKKVLVIGADGQLAFDLIRVFRKDYQVIEARHSDFDITDYGAVEKFILKVKPDMVISTAAFHNTSECELNPEKSFLVNGVGAYNVAKASSAVKAAVVFMSSDYIFDGSKKGYKEDDLPNPLNVYGASKLAGENLTKLANDRYYIIRSGWLFGVKRSGKGHNFVDLMIEKSKAIEKLQIVDDQFGSPTYTFDLASKIKELIDKEAPFDIYHITNSGICSWYQFAKEIFKQANLKMRLEKISTDASKSLVKRPKYSVLTNKQLTKRGFKRLRNWRGTLKDYLKEKYAVL